MNFHSAAFLSEHPRSAGAAAHPKINRRVVAAMTPLVIGLAMAVLPPPAGLPQYSWWYLALFVTVIVGLITEPVPAAAVGFLGVTVAAVLGRFVLFSEAQLTSTNVTSGSLGARHLADYCGKRWTHAEPRPRRFRLQQVMSFRRLARLPKKPLTRCERASCNWNKRPKPNDVSQS
jgi:hypothetical protein